MSKISFRSVLAGLYAASLLLPSCTENLEVSLPGVVSLKAGHIATRAVTDPNTMEATFAEGDKVKITSVGLYSDMSDETFTVGADGMLSSSSTFNYKEGSQASFYASYPEQAKTSDGRTTFTVAGDQSADQAFAENDFMTASRSGSASDGTVELDFTHRLALVKVIIDEAPDAVVTIRDVYPTVSWNHQSGSVTTVKTEPESRVDIIAGRNSKVTGAVEYWACVPAQIIAAETEFVSVSHNGKKYSYKPVSYINLMEGRVYEINLSIARVQDSNVKVAGRKLYVDGSEFFIKGVAITGLNKDNTGYNPFLKAAVDAGANVVRTYDIADLGSTPEKAIQVMDELYASGVYVNFGIFVGRQQDGFDYNNDSGRSEQIRKAKANIEKFKKHPAILMWTVGNECDGGSYGSAPNNNVWRDINEIARYIKYVDGRPTSTALTGTWPLDERYGIQQYLSWIDIISINAYEGASISNLHATYPLDKPYLISEYGPLGTWESACPKTSWGGLIEKNSVDKAEVYRTLYNDCILAHRDEGCIGSHVFLWGYQTHGEVLTWYATFDQFENAALNAVDTMSELWGKNVANRAPTIGEITIDGKGASSSVTLEAGRNGVNASVSASDPDGDVLTYDWKVVRDQRQGAGVLMQPLSGLFSGEMSGNVSFSAPSAAGNYRLIVYARDRQHAKAAMAVIPFKVI